jgi:hypothetical protein
MKIMLYGHPDPAVMGRMEGLEKALLEKGFPVIHAQERFFSWAGLLKCALNKPEPVGGLRLAPGLVRRAGRERPDIFLAVNGGLAPSTVSGIRSCGAVALLWTDAASGDAASLKEEAEVYSQVFAAGSRAMEALGSAGMSVPVAWLPWACDPGANQAVEISLEDRMRYGSAIAFTGPYHKDSEELLAQVTDLDLGIRGPSWAGAGKGSALKPYIDAAPLGGAQRTKVFLASDIVLILHHGDGPGAGIFEAMACGAFVFSAEHKAARDLFRDGEHVVFFKDAQDLRHKARYFLTRPQERSAIARAGQLEVLSRHTYAHRLDAMISFFKL